MAFVFAEQCCNPLGVWIVTFSYSFLVIDDEPIYVAGTKLTLNGPRYIPLIRAKVTLSCRLVASGF
jgi:hypothetical protein